MHIKRSKLNKLSCVIALSVICLTSCTRLATWRLGQERTDEIRKEVRQQHDND